MLPMVGRCYLPATGVLPVLCKVISWGGDYILVCLPACMHACMHTCTTHYHLFLAQPVMPSKFWLQFLFRNQCIQSRIELPPKVVVVIGAWLVIACPLASSRHALLQCGIWGRPDERVPVRLHRAYLAFRRWCLSNKIACSQPAFQARHVPRLFVYC